MADFGRLRFVRYNGDGSVDSFFFWLDFQASNPVASFN